MKVTPSDDEIKAILRDSFRKRNVDLRDFFPDLPGLINCLKEFIRSPDDSVFTDINKYRLKNWIKKAQNDLKKTQKVLKD